MEPTLTSMSMSSGRISVGGDGGGVGLLEKNKENERKFRPIAMNNIIIKHFF